MRVAIIASLTYPTPPPSYGGEIFWSDLSCAFSQLGHDVTLYAATGSKAPPHGKLRYVPCTYGNMASNTEWLVVDWYMDEILKHDIILECMHSRPVAEEIFVAYPEHKHKLFNVLNGVSVPRIPYNIVVGSAKWQELMEAGDTQFKGTPWESMYGAKQQALNKGEILGYVYWACDTKFYCPDGYEREDYFLWMARPSPYKGLHSALKLACHLQFPLKLIMPVKMEEHAFYSGRYREVIEFAQEKNHKIEIVHLPENSSHHVLKRELYRKAKALLISVEAHEPFGLSTIESLACGTPVIASNLGAFPEIIKQGETGFLCSDFSDYVEAVSSISAINPIACRNDAVDRWDRIRAAKQYLELYERMA